MKKTIAIASVLTAAATVSVLATAAPPAPGPKAYSMFNCHIINVDHRLPSAGDAVVRATIYAACDSQNPKQYFFINVATPASGSMQGAPTLSDTTVVPPASFNLVVDNARSALVHNLEVDFSGTATVEGNGMINMTKLNNLLLKH
jgi:hypothetical protein